VDRGVQLKRSAVLERLKLEAHLMQDMRLLLLCLLMFTLVIASCLTERPGPQRLGLLRTFKEVFYLDDSLSEIKTLEDLQGYLRTVTEQARLLQPVSDYYFKEPEGEIRVFEGVTEGWTNPLVLNIRDLKPRIDTLEWTLTAWAQLESEGGGYIIRKPLGQTPETRELYCWGWYMGWPQDKFEFGAHDYRGGSDAPSTHETLLANGTVADDGTIHFIALVVALRVCRPPLIPFTIPYRRAHTAPRPVCMLGGRAPQRPRAPGALLPSVTHQTPAVPRAMRHASSPAHSAQHRAPSTLQASRGHGARQGRAP
jgi:hypothetical protein